MGIVTRPRILTPCKRNLPADPDGLWQNPPRSGNQDQGSTREDRLDTTDTEQIEGQRDRNPARVPQERRNVALSRTGSKSLFRRSTNHVMEIGIGKARQPTGKQSPTLIEKETGTQDNFHSLAKWKRVQTAGAWLKGSRLKVPLSRTGYQTSSLPSATGSHKPTQWSVTVNKEPKSFCVSIKTFHKEMKELERPAFFLCFYVLSGSA